MHKILADWDFYPRSPCGERRARACANQCNCCISIHALLAESDREKPRQTRTDTSISIHALLAESDSALYWFSIADRYFYPRSPCGERPRTPLKCTEWDYFYPRSPCGERREYLLIVGVMDNISIHALLAESDSRHTRTNRNDTRFLSTLSLRRATFARSPPFWTL